MISYATSAGVAAAAKTGVTGFQSQALKELEKAEKLYAPGGTYTKNIEAALARSRKLALASGTQSLVSAGLAGTQMPSGLGTMFEEEIGVPARARAETERTGALADIYGRKAGLLSSFAERLPRTTQVAYGPRSEGILTKHARLAEEARKTPTIAPTPALSSLNLRRLSTIAPQSTMTPMFTEAYMGDPTVRTAAGRPIGERLTGVYDLRTGRRTRAL